MVNPAGLGGVYKTGAFTSPIRHTSAIHRPYVVRRTSSHTGARMIVVSCPRMHDDSSLVLGFWPKNLGEKKPPCGGLAGLPVG